ncbi:MAG: type II toxin-antitoxin system VapC family toxin [Vicinamibacterales bacterium]
MSLFVVDASVVIKWFLPEIHSEAARRWLAAEHHYVAPDLLFSELGSVVWKKVRRGELTPAEGRRLATDLVEVAVDTVATRGLLVDAHAVAVGAGVTVYDAMYLALAVRLDAVLITADDKLVRTVAAHRALAAHVQCVV